MGNIFATYDSVRDLGNLPKVPDPKITPHLQLSKLDVVNVISNETYENIFAKTDPFVQDDYDKLVTAESYFVLSYLVPAINIESSGSGVTKATGFGDSRKENLSEYDLDKIIARYRDNAMKIIKSYVKEVDADENGALDILVTGSVQMACIGEDEITDE